MVPEGQNPDRAALERMAAALGHRGPDDSGIELVDNVGLVHTRLAIVDPTPAGHQPMQDASGRWWLTYNGEIFNHVALRTELGTRQWRGGSDTETLLQALVSWGETAIHRCNGLFAYAALDRERRRLLLVRDRFGVKPLYLAEHDGALWFASEVAALFAAGLPRRPRRDVLAHSIAFGWAVGPLTPFEGVTRLAPGSVASVALGSLEIEHRRWYDPATAVRRERMAELGRRSRAELCGLLESELAEAVGRRLMSDVPLGTMCSGGLDSSLVTALACERQPGVRAYNAAIPDQPDLDEGPYAERVAEALGIELRSVSMTAERWRGALVGVVASNEYPLMHESSVPMALIAELARSDGVKVLLSGEGADELFAGYGFLHREEYLAYLRDRRSPRVLARLMRERLRDHGPLGMASAGARALRLARAGEDPAQLAPDPGADLDQAPEHRGLLGLPMAPEVYAAEYELRRRAAAAYAFHDSPRGRLEAGLLGDLGAYLPHLLNRQDKNTMQHSIETRVPFLDPGVVALALNLPLEARVEPLRKGILREVGARRLPDEIARRKKLGFGFDVRGYMEGAAQPEFVLEGSLRELLEIERDAWREGLESCTSHEALRLWTGEIWCRTLLEDGSVEAVESELWGS